MDAISFQPPTLWIGKLEAHINFRPDHAMTNTAHRLKEGKPFNKYDRSRFYGPFPEDREVGYTDYPFWSQLDKSGLAASQAAAI